MTVFFFTTGNLKIVMPIRFLEDAGNWFILKKIIYSHSLCVFLHFANVSSSPIQFFHCRNEKYSSMSNNAFFTLFLTIVKL